MQKIDTYFSRTLYSGNKGTTFTTNEQERGGKKLILAPGRRLRAGEWREQLADTVSLTVISPEAEEVWHEFTGDFELRTAAGGVVENAAGDTLMIYRNDRWDLPKGHLEEGESIEECALREVEEECGIGGLRIVAPIVSTLHTYEWDGRSVLKRTHWYRMRTDSTATPAPQTEEGITRAEWLAPAQVAEALRDTYPTIRNVMDTLETQK